MDKMKKKSECRGVRVRVSIRMHKIIYELHVSAGENIGNEFVSIGRTVFFSWSDAGGIFFHP